MSESSFTITSLFPFKSQANEKAYLGLKLDSSKEFAPGSTISFIFNDFTQIKNPQCYREVNGVPTSVSTNFEERNPSVALGFVDPVSESFETVNIGCFFEVGEFSSDKDVSFNVLVKSTNSYVSEASETFSFHTTPLASVELSTGDNSFTLTGKAKSPIYSKQSLKLTVVNASFEFVDAPTCKISSHGGEEQETVISITESDLTYESVELSTSDDFSLVCQGATLKQTYSGVPVPFILDSTTAGFYSTGYAFNNGAAMATVVSSIVLLAAASLSYLF